MEDSGNSNGISDIHESEILRFSVTAQLVVRSAWGFLPFYRSSYDFTTFHSIFQN
jgi:hypothetical protein